MKIAYFSKNYAIAFYFIFEVYCHLTVMYILCKSSNDYSFL